MLCLGLGWLDPVMMPNSLVPGSNASVRMPFVARDCAAAPPLSKLVKIKPAATAQQRSCFNGEKMAGQVWS